MTFLLSHRRWGSINALAFALSTLSLIACAAGNNDEPAGGGSSDGGSGLGGEPSEGGSGAGFNQGGGDGGGGYMPPPEVFGHSSTILYKLNPVTKDVGNVAPFNGCEGGIVDLALDAESNLFATTNDHLYRVDKKTAVCTLISEGTYPNSLSFVPAGTLDPDEEALVGFVDDQYVRIDVATGTITNVGAPWNNGYVSSGDVVSVKNGPTFLTIKDDDPDDMNCADCLVEINPKTGAFSKEYGSIVGYEKVFGAAFWAGSVYGFTNDGKIFEIVIENNQLTTIPIATPNGLSFWGAGSSTSAPPVPR